MQTKKRFLFTILVAALAVLASAVAYGQGTPDGDTPANEGICDDAGLMFATPGLYGLCVAFCEAQDWASISDPITEAELDALEAASPSGRILAAYNQMKTDTDPDMPCILVEEPCPCWSTEELNSIDGFDDSGNSIGKGCALIPGVFDQVVENPPFTDAIAASADPPELFGGFCRWTRQTPTGFEQRLLRVDDGTLTAAEADACAAQVEAHAVDLCP